MKTENKRLCIYPKGHTTYYRKELSTKHKINAENQKRSSEARK